MNIIIYRSIEDYKSLCTLTTVQYYCTGTLEISTINTFSQRIPKTVSGKKNTAAIKSIGSS